MSLFLFFAAALLSLCCHLLAMIELEEELVRKCTIYFYISPNCIVVEFFNTSWCEYEETTNVKFIFNCFYDTKF